MLTVASSRRSQQARRSSARSRAQTKSPRPHVQAGTGSVDAASQEVSQPAVDVSLSTETAEISAGRPGPGLGANVPAETHLADADAIAARDGDWVAPLGLAPLPKALRVRRKRALPVDHSPGGRRAAVLALIWPPSQIFGRRWFGLTLVAVASILCWWGLFQLGGAILHRFSIG